MPLQGALFTWSIFGQSKDSSKSLCSLYRYPVDSTESWPQLPGQVVFGLEAQRSSGNHSCSY